MYSIVKKRIEKELNTLALKLDNFYGLNNLSPLLSGCIKNFILRKGKRIRPFLFVIGYLGFAHRPARGLYTTAASIELLHDFILVHDDIIDKSDKRRGLLSMHRMLEERLKYHPGRKFSGQDLGIIAGDVMYAIAIKAFLSIKEDPRRKEEALKKFIETAVTTGTGEFIELLAEAKDIGRIKKSDIYNIYDCKTGSYTFSAPLSTGAILAGAPASEINKLSSAGIYLGRSFQIKDDIIGMFESEKKSGKSALVDLRESKKTLLIWYAYRNSDKKGKVLIKKLLAKKDVNLADLNKMRAIIRNSGSLENAVKEIEIFKEMALRALWSSSMSAKYSRLLIGYLQELL